MQFSNTRIQSTDIRVENEWMSSRVFWAKVISSERESLFTHNTKHSFYEIQYALEGRISMTLGEGERVPVDESDFIVIPPDTDHQIMDGDTEGARFIMAFTLQPGIRLSRGALASLHSCLPHRESPCMRKLLSLMLEKGDADSPSAKRQIVNLAESFLLEILAILSEEVGADPSSAMEGGAEEKVREILSFVHSRGGIWLAALA